MRIELTGADGQENQRRPFNPVRALCDARGLFALDWVPSGAHELLVRSNQSDRLGRARASILCAPGDELEVELVLGPGATIRGRVVDEQARPLADWSVRAESNGWRETTPGCISSWNLQRSDRTEADGTFLLANLDGPGVPADAEVTLRVSAPADEPFPPRAELRGVKPGTQDVLLRVEHADVEPGHLRGRLLDAGGGVPQDVRLTVWGEASSEGFYVDVDPTTGAFECSVQVPGRYAVRVLRGGITLVSSGPHEVCAGSTIDVGTIGLGELGRVAVRLVGVPDEWLELVGFDLVRPGTEWKKFERDGRRFQSQPTAPGVWNLHLTGEAWFAPDREVEVRAGEAVELEVEAVRGFEVDLAFDFADQAAAWKVVEVEIRDASDTGLQGFGSLEIGPAPAARGPFRFTIR